ncbi:MAG TPA: molybdopterin-dependent oxidoreductase [Candidatus Aveggerthella excrementigallinarum]|nr:molybdopterin-dependent oxidoreductase [Candidatus Aveggerthella excrementigallinarum]
MSDNALTRRSFLKRSAAGAAVVAGSGFVGFSAWEQGQQARAAGTKKAVHSLCNSCSSKCGFTAYVGEDGRFTEMVGDKDHPYCDGTLCARGYGYASIAWSEDRLTDPLKKNDAGEFEAISWDQAYAEIAEKVQSIISSDGPQALAMIQDPRPSGSYYTARFMNALGSANVYTHGVACNMSKNSGMTQAIGAADFTADVANAKMVMFLGRSYADGIRPSSLHALQEGHAKGARFVMVDPRYNNSMHFCDEWVPIRPGTDLALILGMAHVLVTQGTYDTAYVEQYTVGFEDWAARLAEYTPEWAAEKTGIPAETIERLANEMWEAAPQSCIEQGWRAAYGCAHQNSGETARALCLFNTLLGCWGLEGGAYMPASASAGKLSDPKFAAPAKPADKILGQAEYPLSSGGMGVSTYALSQVPEGTVKGVFFYQSNCVAGYSNPAQLTEFLASAELSVAIDVQLTETCQACQYVLPDTCYLERLEVPEFVGGKVPVVSLRDRVIEKVHPNTKPVDEIFAELAEACGVGEYFQFTVDELADAQLQTVGLSLDALREEGTHVFEDKALKYALKTSWGTADKKVHFTSEACEKAGFPASPGWLEPKVTPGEGEFRLIGGKQAIHTHTQTANIPALMEITKKYGLERIWMNADVAEQMGIADGDEVELSSETHTGRTRVKVTQRIEPTSIYLPSHYGCSVPEQKTAYQVGLRQMDFVPFHIEPGYGGTMSQETIVTVKKVGA